MLWNIHHIYPDFAVIRTVCFSVFMNIPNFGLGSLAHFTVVTRSPGILVNRSFCHPCHFFKMLSYTSGTPLHKTSRQDPFNSLVSQSFGPVRIFGNNLYKKLLNCSHQSFGAFSTQEKTRLFLTLRNAAKSIFLDAPN